MFRIFPSVPITWRSSSCVQFGADDPVLIDGLLPADVSLIEDLRLGIGSSQFYARAQELGADLSRASSLITLLGEAGVLVPEGPDSGAVRKGSPVFAAARSFGLAPDQSHRSSVLVPCWSPVRCGRRQKGSSLHSALRSPQPVALTS